VPRAADASATVREGAIFASLLLFGCAGCLTDTFPGRKMPLREPRFTRAAMKCLLVLTAVIFGAALTSPVQAQKGPSSNPDTPWQSPVRNVADLMLAAGPSDFARVVERPKALSIVPVQEPGGPHISSPYCTYRPGEDCCCEFFGGDNPPAHMCMTPPYCRETAHGACVEGQAGRQPC
jgi:hypothetical protein